MDSNPSGQDGTTPATGVPLEALRCPAAGVPIVHSPGIGSITCFCGTAMQRTGPLWACPECSPEQFDITDVDLQTQAIITGAPIPEAGLCGCGISGSHVCKDAHGVEHAYQMSNDGGASWTASPPLPPQMLDAIKRAHEWPTAEDRARRAAHLGVDPNSIPGFSELMARATDAGIIPIPLRGAPKTPEFAEALARQIDPAYAAVVEKFGEVIEQAVVADGQRRTAAARAYIAARVQDALIDAVTGPGSQWSSADGHLGGDGYRAMAEAAADVLADILRDPPSFVTYPDGTEKIEQR